MEQPPQGDADAQNKPDQAQNAQAQPAQAQPDAPPADQPQPDPARGEKPESDKPEAAQAENQQHQESQPQPPRADQGSSQAPQQAMDGTKHIPPSMDQPMLDPSAMDPNSFHPDAMQAAQLGMFPDMNQPLDPSVMAGLIPGFGDPSMMGMMPDGQMMMPMMPLNGNMAPLMPQNGVSADDIALYDRQIRLWGMAAQARIQNANILLITIRALGNEIAKNLVLAGVGSLTILDDSTVTEADLGAQFFLSEADPETVIGQNRAEAASAAIRRLNPRVAVHVDAGGVKSKGPSYFGAYDIVVATDLEPDSFNLINTATRLNGRPFYAAGSHGMYGFIFSDLIEHDFVIERDAGNVPAKTGSETLTRSVVGVTTRDEDGGDRKVECVAKRELYSTWFLASDLAVLPEDYTKSKRRLRAVTPALSCLRALWEFMQRQADRLPSTRDDFKLFTQIATRKHKALSLPSETLRPELLRSFLQNLGSEIAPVVAILGGQLAQDIINVLGRSQQPIQNMVVFDGNSSEGLMYPLHPEGVLGAGQLTSMAGEVPGGVPNGGGDMMAPPGMGGMDMGLGMGMDHSAMGGMPPMGGEMPSASG